MRPMISPCLPFPQPPSHPPSASSSRAWLPSLPVSSPATAGRNARSPNRAGKPLYTCRSRGHSSSPILSNCREVVSRPYQPLRTGIERGSADISEILAVERANLLMPKQRHLVRAECLDRILELGRQEARAEGSDGLTYIDCRRSETDEETDKDRDTQGGRSLQAPALCDAAYEKDTVCQSLVETC